MTRQKMEAELLTLYREYFNAKQIEQIANGFKSVLGPSFAQSGTDKSRTLRSTFEISLDIIRAEANIALWEDDGDKLSEAFVGTTRFLSAD